jgi:predicted transglutaminase-like cysteine proteinase
MNNSNLSKEEIKAIVRDIHAMVFKNFTYKTDQAQYGIEEKWVMPDIDYDGTQAFIGDCEDFSLAARKLVREKGLRSRLVYCTVEDGSGHMVLEVEGWIIDNRQRKVVSNKKLMAKGYVFKRISGYDIGDDWHTLGAA